MLKYPIPGKIFESAPGRVDLSLRSDRGDGYLANSDRIRLYSLAILSVSSRWILAVVDRRIEELESIFQRSIPAKLRQLFSQIGALSATRIAKLIRGIQRALEAVNFLLFLTYGRYATLLERILRVHFCYGSRDNPAQIVSTIDTQTQIWGNLVVVSICYMLWSN